MGSVLLLGDSDNPDLVGELGANLTKTMRAGLAVAHGLVVPIGKYVGYGMSNELLRKFDELKFDKVILCASLRETPEKYEVIGPVGRNNLISAINYIQDNAKRRGEQSAIIIQEYLDGEFRGKVHSLNPYTGERSEILIEVKLWANNSVLGNDEEPDMILVDKKDGTVSLESNEEELVLEASEVQKLYRAAKKMEKILKTPVTLDWGLVNGVLYILRTRQINM
ncbi:hypothetical protein IKG13_03710 [Candidatus Saccharibacteria bacterium]|nr:hypothetical protein [Candidatus Saccharibacteria bacterium]MBR3377871.1 hypothetical protein [Candidatus Saccharibacteria bacterium]